MSQNPRDPSPTSHRTRRRRALTAASIAALVVVVLGAVAIGLSKQASDSAQAQRAAASYTPSPIYSAPPPPPIVGVIGDETTTAAGKGVDPSQRWVVVNEQRMAAHFDVKGAAGEGYVRMGADGLTFVKQAERVPTSAAVVLFFGGGNDSGVGPKTVEDAASRALAAAVERVPSAKVIVVGPAVRGKRTLKELGLVRSGLKAAASRAHVQWVDPAAEKWLGPIAKAPMSGATLTAADQTALATHLQTVVRAALQG